MFSVLEKSYILNETTETKTPELKYEYYIDLNKSLKVSNK